MNTTTTRELAFSIRDQWRQGQSPDALAALASYPHLEEDRSAVIDLAYEEFCLRRHRGEEVDPEEFCQRFPGYRSCLREVLHADGAIALPGSILGDLKPVSETWPEPGEELCGCQVSRELGRGSFSRAYLATEASTGHRPVVLKVSKEKTNEACTLGRLHHDHVVPVLWARRDEGTGWYVVCMPFFGNATLMDVRDRLYPRNDSRPPLRALAILEAIEQTARHGGPQPDYSPAGPGIEKLTFVRGVARLGSQLAEALAFLHARNLSHCDLKPPNVLLTARGRPLLLDFNLSRNGADPDARMGGTVAYMAPEHLDACLSGQALDARQAARSDLFSLGVVLYELLTGSPPFGLPRVNLPLADAARNVRERQQAGFVPIRERNRAVPRRLARWVESCLCTDPADRPASAARLALALQPRPTPWPVRWLATLLALVAVTGVLTWLAVRPGPAEPAPDPLESRRVARKELATAIVLRRQGKGEEARPHLEEACHLLGNAINGHIEQEGGTAGHWRDHLDRCRALLLLDRPKQACSEFELLEEVLKNQEVGPARRRACLAYGSYCFARHGKHDLAWAYGKKALNQGDRSAAVLNNLAYCALTRPDGSGLTVARQYLDRAGEVDSRLQAVYRNRADLALRMYLWGLRQSSPVNASVLGPALQDVEKAIRLGQGARKPEPASLYVLAAQLYAAAAETDLTQRSRYVRQGKQYARKASELGAVVDQLIKDPILGRSLRLQKKALTGLRQQAEVPGYSTYLVDPLPDGLE